MSIRTAVPVDAPAIARVHVSSWLTTYRGLLPDSGLDTLSVEQRESAWRQMITDTQTGTSSSCIYVAEDAAGKVVGFASGGPEREPDSGIDGELYAIYLLKEHQRSGIGQQLVSRVVDRLLEQGHRSMRVWVLEGNPAQRFYERLSGQRAGEKALTAAGQSFTEVAYSWPDLSALGRQLTTR